VGAAVFVVLLVAFFGISLSQIKSHVDEAMGKTAILEAENSARDAAQKANDSLKTVINAQDQATTYAKKLESLSQKYKIEPIYQFHAVNKDGGWRFHYSSDSVGPTKQGWTLDGHVFNAIKK
jgi:hypothetical protein